MKKFICTFSLRCLFDVAQFMDIFDLNSWTPFQLLDEFSNSNPQNGGDTNTRSHTYTHIPNATAPTDSSEQQLNGNK